MLNELLTEALRCETEPLFVQPSFVNNFAECLDLISDLESHTVWAMREDIYDYLSGNGGEVLTDLVSKEQLNICLLYAARR